MWFYLLAAASLLHTYFWGAGVACLALPRQWRRWWWVFAPGFGLALQSAVVWVGAHTTLAGTRAYAWPSELIPLVLLAVAWRRAGAFRRARAALAGAVGATALVLAAGWLLLSPMAEASRRPTSLSLGSCDSADYAAGARVLQEFARDDRTGFLGLPEVTRVRSVDYFFDFWLRLNHFTPSALIAHNGTIMDSQSHELTSLTGVVLVLCNVPLMLFLARVALGLRGGALLGLTGLLAFSPLQTYAVHHTALGQLLAAQGIMLLTVAVLGAVRLRRPWALAAPTLAGFWIIAGGYNLVLPVCLAPAGGWLLAQVALRRDWRGAGRICTMLLAMLAACAVLFWTRFAGLAERFSLFEQYNFGWPVPRLTPEGWLGLVGDSSLNAWPGAVRPLLVALVLAGWLGGIGLLWRRQRARALVAVMFVVPLAAGWAILDREAQVRANASYDAYKLLAVFQGELLIGLGGWFLAMQARCASVRFVAGVLAAAVLIGNLAVGAQFRRGLAQAPLQVDRSLTDLGWIEHDARIASLNMRVEDFWARMWANVFLLRKPQYFVTHSYEGRLDTPLRGEWDLSDSLVRTVPARPGDSVAVNERFHLVRAGTHGLVLAAFTTGWYETERRERAVWRWTAGGDARLVLSNHTGVPRRMQVTLRAQAVTPRQLRMRLNGRALGVQPVGLEIGTFDFGEIMLPPGDSELALQTSEPSRPAGDGDNRNLSVAVHEVTLRELPSP
jgi:hypothetical protein